MAGVTVVPAPAGATGWGKDFFTSIMTMEERKRISKIEVAELKMKKEALGMEKEAFGLSQKERLANIELAELNRQIASLYSLPAKKLELAEAKKRASTLDELMKSKDPKEKEVAIDALIGGALTRYYQQKIGIMGAERDALLTGLSAEREGRAAERFQYQRDRDDMTMLFDLALGKGAYDLKAALGDEEFKKFQTEAAGKLVGEKRRLTPHDYGWANVMKKPREPLDFETAYKYWRHKNIDDIDMWNDWADELTARGWEFDEKTGKVTHPGGGRSLEETTAEELEKELRGAVK